MTDYLNIFLTVLKQGQSKGFITNKFYESNVSIAVEWSLFGKSVLLERVLLLSNENGIMHHRG